MKIYTKVGDEGFTALKNQKVSKSSLIIDVLGKFDELNVLVGSCISCFENNNNFKDSCEFLFFIQKSIFEISAFVAGYGLPNNQYKELATSLENEIDKLPLKVKPIKNFILPGGSLEVVNINLARVKTRELERKLVTLFENDIDFKNKHFSLLPSVNRLSDYFFILGIYTAEKQNIPIQKWILK